MLLARAQYELLFRTIDRVLEDRQGSVLANAKLINTAWGAFYARTKPTEDLPWPNHYERDCGDVREKRGFA